MLTRVQARSYREVAESIAYEPYGAMNALNWGDAGDDYPLTRAFDLNGRMTSRVIQDNVGTVATQQDNDYSYDLAGNITNITDNVLPADSETYAYDALYRLAYADTASGPYGRLDYLWDAAGNRVAADTLSSPAIDTFSYAVDSNRITARQATSHTGVVRNWTYTHSDSGNRTESDSDTFKTQNYFYDSSDRMVETTRDGVTYATFGHNAAGQRVVKTTSGSAPMHFTYNLSGQLIAEQASTGAGLKEYIRLDGMILGFVSGGVLYWMHQDHIGRPRLVTAQNGDVQWQTAWMPFGKQRAGRTSGTVPTDLRFPGQRWDWENGFAYNGFRDYEYATARYAQSDPIGLGGGWNTYAYVGGTR